MATELLQLAVGQYDVTNVGFHSGVFLRDVTSKPITAEIQPLLGVTPSQIDYMQAAVGKYPFDLYGSLVVEADLGFALETQTLELMDTSWFHDFTPGHVGPDAAARAVAHVVRRQRRPRTRGATCGSTRATPAGTSSSTPRSKGFLEGDTEGYPDDTGYADFDDLMKAVYAHGDEWRAESGPVALPTSEDTLFDLQRYHGGALVLYALRQKIGDAAFQRIERAYVDRFTRPLGLHRRLHRARRAGLRPRRRRAVPARLGLRHQDAADAGPPGLDRQPGRRRQGAHSRSPRRRPARRSAADRARCRRPRWAAAPHRDGPGRALASVLSVRQVKRTPGVGIALVAVGAGLWGTDALFRRGLALECPVEVVFWEHLLLALLTLPLIVRGLRTMRGAPLRDWVAIAIVGGGSSVAATVLLTEAFSARRSDDAAAAAEAAAGDRRARWRRAAGRAAAAALTSPTSRWRCSAAT